MPKRREPGDGSLFYDEERKRWIYYLPHDEMGKRPRVSSKTKAEVLAKAEEIKAKRAQGLDLDAKQPTIEQFSEVWLRDVVKRTRRESFAPAHRGQKKERGQEFYEISRRDQNRDEEERSALASMLGRVREAAGEFDPANLTD